jgi:predicted DNA-binding transcriptional regulator YafY
MGKKRAKKRIADTQPQLTRIHALVKRIQEGDYPSQKMLAKEWEKNSRTIQRDLDYMRDFLGLPLAYEPFKYGYYFTEPVSRFPMVPISERELVSVFVAQKALRLYHGTPFERPLKAAFEKLVGSLKGEISVAWADLDSAISFRGIEANPSDAETFQKLSAAVRSRNEVEFCYKKLAQGAERKANQRHGLLSPALSSRGREGEMRRVRPYHLGCVGNQWYLFGYDLARKDMRKFVPSRMSDLRVLDTKFERPRDFSVDDLLKGSFGVYSGGRELIQMRIWFDPWAGQLVKERKWHRSQEIKELRNGAVELTLELSSFVEIVPWILGWGEHARALAPKALVKEVRRVVSEVGKMYGRRAK